jgi:catechol 2,3-dioxygenase-like lactoylglutathione lyase family enzyme
MRIKLGVVGHFSLAVRDPNASAAWWTRNFDLEEIFRFEDGVGISNDAITIALFSGVPGPDVLEHMSFHLRSMKELRAALIQLKTNGVEIEDPDDEIGPEAPGSPHLGLWFHDPDGYRWELSVQHGATRRS